MRNNMQLMKLAALRLLKLAAVIAVADALSGCATVGLLQRDVDTAWQVATSAKVSPTAVILAANAFDALEASATNYLRLPKCSTVATSICRDPGATRAMIPAVRAGRIARNNLEAFLRTHPGELGPQGLYDALASAARSIQAIYGQYQLGAVQ
jgi:hypothetical protein